ncbi:ABC transporter ATP-binding protein [Paenibacillus sp. PL2-23]|uniref:ABC transporter ATP-binding protein n=1 Tax=Paenibacillus sp. PL2-23 TaxID=2100729 RepID=UPI0030F80FD3
MHKYAWIVPYLNENKWRLFLGILFAIIEAGLGIVLLSIERTIIDDIIVSGNTKIIPEVFSIFISLALLYFVFMFLSPYQNFINQFSIFKRLNQDLMRKVQSKTIIDIQQERTAKLANIVGSDILGVSSTIADYIPNSLRTITRVVVLVTMFTYYTPLLALVAIMVSVIYYILAARFSSRIQSSAREVQEKRAQLLVEIQESIASTREVLVYDRIDWEQRKLDKAYNKYYRQVMLEGRIVNQQFAAGDMLRWLPTVFLFVYGGIILIYSSITIGTFIILYQFTYQLMFSLQELYNAAMKVFGKLAHIDRVGRLMGQQPARSLEFTIEEPIKSIRFHDVYLMYPEAANYALKGLSFHIPMGKSIAIVGKSGCGKSSIAKLLIRFTPPTSGNITINNYPIEQVSNESLTSKCAVVLQDPYIFKESVKNNVLLGNEVSEGYLSQVLDDACVNDFISTFPDGYDTVVSERGSTLSGGQKQRIALSRALLRNPELLILDEATSALDLQTELKVLNKLHEVRKGKTTIYITHNLRTIKEMDHIIVLDEGKVVGEGTHDQLINTNSCYRDLIGHTLQVSNTK